MAVVPRDAQDVDVSKITFGDVVVLDNGGKIVYIQYDGGTLHIRGPKLKLPFDTKFFLKDGSHDDTGKYNIRGNFVDMAEGSKDRIFHDKMIEFDEMLKTAAKERSVEWFRKKNMSAEVIDTIFTDTIKVSIDPKTGEPNGRYPPSFTFKIKKKQGYIDLPCYDSTRMETVKVEDKKTGIIVEKHQPPQYNINDPEGDDYAKIDDLLKKGTTLRGLVKCDFVWLGDSDIGCIWCAEALKISVPQQLNEYAFDDSDDEPAAELNTESFLESSEEEDGVARPAN